MSSSMMDLQGAHVMLSAYACAPEDGSEPGVGWQLLQGWLALGARVTLVTRANNVAAIRSHVASGDGADRLCIIGHDLAAPLLWLKRHTPFGQQWYYGMWQLSGRRLLRHAHHDDPFDIAHHGTFAADWMPAATTAIAADVPTIWGPVGGATRRTPGSLITGGHRNRVFEGMRRLAGTLGRLAFGRQAARLSALTVAQNRDVHAVFARVARSIAIEPNVFVPDELVMQRTEIDEHSLVGVGRLVAWKGWELAIRAHALLPDEFTLTIYGDGPDRARLAALARELKVEHRVVLRGFRPRDEVIAAVSAAHCLVHPSLHDSAGAAVGEALVNGRPVVVLDVGGPAEIAAACGGDVLATDQGDLVARLAEAMRTPREPVNSDRWRATRTPQLLHDWAAQSGRSLRKEQRGNN